MMVSGGGLKTFHMTEPGRLLCLILSTGMRCEEPLT